MRCSRHLTSFRHRWEPSFKELGQDLGGAQVLSRNSLIWDVVDPAYAWLQLLNDTINKQPPLDSHGRQQQIHDCVQAVDGLNNPLQPDQIWNLDFDWEPFWTDAGVFSTETYDWSDGQGQWVVSLVDVGYGSQTPPTNPDGTTVFAYSYSLPTYLLAITCLISVAGALDPAFPTDPSYTSILSQAATVLQNKHDAVQGGITILAPTTWAQKRSYAAFGLGRAGNSCGCVVLGASTQSGWNIRQLGRNHPLWCSGDVLRQQHH